MQCAAARPGCTRTSEPLPGAAEPGTLSHTFLIAVAPLPTRGLRPLPAPAPAQAVLYDRQAAPAACVPSLRRPSAFAEPQGAASSAIAELLMPRSVGAGGSEAAAQLPPGCTRIMCVRELVELPQLDRAAVEQLLASWEESRSTLAGQLAAREQAWAEVAACMAAAADDEHEEVAAAVQQAIALR